MLSDLFFTLKSNIYAWLCKAQCGVNDFTIFLVDYTFISIFLIIICAEHNRNFLTIAGVHVFYFIQALYNGLRMVNCDTLFLVLTVCGFLEYTFLLQKDCVCCKADADVGFYAVEQVMKDLPYCEVSGFCSILVAENITNNTVNLDFG